MSFPSFATQSLTTLREIKLRPALFLDRDGVLLRVEKGKYILSEMDICWIPGSIHALDRLASLDVPIIVVTNQQCVGKGLIDNQGIGNIHARMNQHSLYAISAFYYCPHLDSDGCYCRKPKTGLLETAMRNLMINPLKSILVSDTHDELYAAAELGILPIWVASGLSDVHPSCECFDNLLQAVPFIESWFSKVFE